MDTHAHDQSAEGNSKPPAEPPPTHTAEENVTEDADDGNCCSQRSSTLKLSRLLDCRHILYTWQRLQMTEWVAIDQRPEPRARAAFLRL